jgi:hypothetical protein
MPILAKSTGRNLPGRGLINPAFTIKIVPATDDMQQNPSTGRDNQVNDYLDNLKVGTDVIADMKHGEIMGTVQRIEKNELGDGVFVIIKDKKGKDYKVEGSRIKRVSKPSVDDDKARVVSSPALFAESKFLSYESFSKAVLENKSK